MYLSNAEKEALWLTGYGDVPPWRVEQALGQALERGTYIPGEESLRLRLADALNLQERLMRVLIDELETGLDPGVIPAGDEDAVDSEIEGAVATEEAATEEAAGEIVNEADSLKPQGDVWVATDGEDAAPSAVHQEVEDQDFSTFSKSELVDYAFDMFGVKLKPSESKDRLIAHVQGLVDEANGTEV